MVLLWLLWIILACYLLSIVCDRYFVVSLDEIAKKWKLRDDVSWATLMAVWSSAPELFTSLIALFSWAKVGLGAGTIIWSAIFNILIIIWGSALFLKAVLDKKILLRDSLFYALSILLIFLSFWDGQVTLVESVLFLAAYLFYILYLIYFWNKRSSHIDELVHVVEHEVEDLEETLEKKSVVFQRIDTLIESSFPKKNSAYVSVFFISLWWIILLSWLLVESGVVLAQSLWIPEVIIWLTILAAWTSVPDLISSIIVAKQGRGDMAVTNALGSEIFFICFFLWFSRFIYPLIHGSVPISTAWLWISVSLLFGILILVFCTFVLTKFRINKYVWWFFISIYLAYVCWMIWWVLFAA